MTSQENNAELLAALMGQEELLRLLVAAINKPKLGLHFFCWQLQNLLQSSAWLIVVYPIQH